MTVLLTFYIFLIVISDLSYSCMPQSSNVIQKETYGRLIRGFLMGITAHLETASQITGITLTL